MASRLELRTNYLRHRHRLDTSTSGRFSLEQPKNFPIRKRDALFAGNCYEQPLSSFDADDPSRAPPPRIVRKRPDWDGSVLVTHGLDGHRPRSAASRANVRGKQDAAHTMHGSQRDRPTSAGGSTFGVSNLGQHAGWGAQDSTLYASPQVDTQSHTKTAGSVSSQGPNDSNAQASNWSVDLTPEQSKAFVEFVTLLGDVESAGGMSMVHLAQAAVDQATAHSRRSRLRANGGDLRPA